MPLDRYMPCPCGSGKKIKFCCEDLIGELETIQRMLEGEQRLACLEHIDKLLRTFPDRACLLAIKALLQSEMQQEEALSQTLDLFEAKHPGNPLAAAERAIQIASTGGAAQAVLKLQEAIAVTEQQIPTRVYEAIGIVGRALLAEGNIPAARAHLLLQASIGGSEDPRAMSLLTPLIRSAEIPLLLRDEQQLSEAPVAATYKQSFDQAAMLAAKGNWLAAADRFDQLVNEHELSEQIMRNLAILRAWLGQTRESAAAWRSYAALDTVTLAESVEAEAIAQLIDPDVEFDTVALARLKFEIEDLETLTANLIASRRTESIPVAQASPIHEEGEPPPQAIYLLLNREMPQTGAGIQFSEIPCVLGQCYLFGRQTDRVARLELVIYRDDQAEQSISELEQLAGGLLKSPTEEKVLSEIPLLDQRMNANWRIPADTPPADRERLAAEQRHEAIFTIWLGLPNAALGGKTPRQAAVEKDLLTRLLASILVLESSTTAPQDSTDFNRLRTDLGLPCPEPIDPEGLDISQLPLVHMARVDVGKLSDEQLVIAYRRAATLAAITATAQLAPEVIARESLDDKVDKAEAYGMLASQAATSDKALELLARARELAVAGEQSPARWTLAELDLRLRRGEATDAQRLLQEIQANHVREPGIAEAVYELLARHGIIDPRGAGKIPVQGEAAAAGVPMQDDQEETPSESQQTIWTPDAPATGAQGQKKSAIWTPDT
jgi:hypothetical protein